MKPRRWTIYFKRSGMFSCLCECAGVQVGKKYYENLTPEKIDALLAK